MRKVLSHICSNITKKKMKSRTRFQLNSIWFYSLPVILIKELIFEWIQGCQQILKYFFKVIFKFLTQFDPKFNSFLHFSRSWCCLLMAAIVWEKHENNQTYEALFLKCNSNLQIMKSSNILWNLLVLIN